MFRVYRRWRSCFPSLPNYEWELLGTFNSEENAKYYTEQYRVNEYEYKIEEE